MNLPLRIGWSALALAAALGWATEAAAISASSANYVLERHAFTGGNPNSATPVASANFALAASSLGGLSQGAATNAARTLHSGYLVPWSVFLSQPDMTRIVVSNGILRLEWAAVAGASEYIVDNVAAVTNFSTNGVARTSLTRWDAMVSASSQFYRVRAWSAP